MKNNKILFLNEIKLGDISKDRFRIIISGEKIQTKADFLMMMEKEFLFPYSCHGDMDAFMDFIMDLSWFQHDKIDLIIMNQKEFLKSSDSLKAIIIECFENDILPYWEKGVLEDTFNGKCKEFFVYIVDNIKSE